MTADFSAIDERIRAAKAELSAAVEQAWQDLSQYQRDNQPTEEERRQLQEAALRGDLGADMQELARRIERGDDTWDAVFSGNSPNAELLRGHIDRVIAQNRDAIAEALEEDEDFDRYRHLDDQG